MKSLWYGEAVGLIYKDEQQKSIEDYKIPAKRRAGVLPIFKTLPLFLDKIESYVVCSETGNMSRQTANSAYDRVLRALFESLNSLERETGGDDVNVQIAVIENMHYIYSEMRARRLITLDSFVKLAKSNYDASLNIYCKAVIRKPFLKLQVLEYTTRFDVARNSLRAWSSC